MIRTGGFRRAGSAVGRDVIGAAAILLFAATGFFLMQDNLALLTRIVAMALLVLSLDLVTGYCGVATLGHAALFGSGAYAGGMLSAHFGMHDPLLMTAAGILAGALGGIVSAGIMLRARGLPQLVLSIAIVYLFHEAANKASTWTGGSDGLTGIMPSPVFGIHEFDLYGRTAYVFGIALLLVVFVVLRQIVRSPFGMLCRAVRQDPVRVRAMGGSPDGAVARMYAISGAVAGAGGALSAISTQVVGLDALSFTQSAEALVMLVLGGAGSLFGALIGTAVFMLFEDYVSAASPFHWLFLVGAMLIAVVLFAPKGIYGSIAAYLEGKGRAKP